MKKLLTILIAFVMGIGSLCYATTDIPIDASIEGSGIITPEETVVADVTNNITNDLSASFVTSEESLTEILLTEEEKELLYCGEKVNVWLEVEFITVDFSAVKSKSFNKDDVYQYFIIKVFKKIGDRKKVEATNLSEPIKVKFKLPKDLITASQEFSIYYVGGKSPRHYYTGSETTIKMETQNLGLYAITYDPSRVFVAKGIAKDSNKIKVNWLKIDGAYRYYVYVAECNHDGKTYKMKKYKSKYFTDNCIITGLKKDHRYKIKVYAYGGGERLGTSKTMHVTTKSSKYTNIKKIKVNKTKITLKVGKKAQLKTIIYPYSKKKKTLNSHIGGVKARFTSSNQIVATVSDKGVIRAKKAGTCYIWSQAINGTWTKTKVIVK